MNVPSILDSSNRDSGRHADPVARAGNARTDMETHGLIGQSPAFRSLLNQIRRIATTEAPVLIEGETGSGKELAARAVHYLGSRRSHPFVPVNCGAIPDTLIESELFGHARGAFTDARNARRGLIAQAGGGTLFLDEVDALTPRAQVALLRFLQDGRYRPVGEDRELSGDVRIIAASNTSLPALVEAGRFRGDLLYRLNILTLPIPPLRERGGDVELLAQHYLQRYSQQYGLPLRPYAACTLRWMSNHRWPGNVRELENLVHRLVLQTDGVEISYQGSYPGSHQGSTPVASAEESTTPTAATSDFQTAKAHAVALFEQTYLRDLLRIAGGNVSAAARMANKERRALGKLLKKHGIVPQRQTPA